MIRKQKSLLGSILLLTIFFLIPTAVFATNFSIVISYGQMHYKPLSGNGVSGSFTSNTTVYAFISNWTGVSYFLNYVSVPPYALWNNHSAGGSFDVKFPDKQTYYIAFANLNLGVKALVQYTISSGIPGFELILAFFPLLTLLGLICQKKKLL
ncbi:MAG: hypothetical protein ACTSQI_00380 [Candidatus Helarchaeota archaeon]